MTTNDGGPAFPTIVPPVPTMGLAAGMSLRDWFAGQALNGMLAHPTRYGPRLGAGSYWHYAIAREAYEIADAMLAARTEKSP